MEQLNIQCSTIRGLGTKLFSLPPKATGKCAEQEIKAISSGEHQTANFDVESGRRQEGLARTADYGRRAVWRDVRMTWRAATTADSHASEE